ncbi:MAG: hypothetical protein JSS29_08225 [Proteobacteria bacterium]|nr:hypothetical protein [Pseudomonadota bacterium]
MRKLSERTWRSAAAGTLAVLCLGITAVGAIHTHAGRSLLARLGVPCPVNTVSPAKVLAVREFAVSRARGSVPAPSRPALGLELDVSTEAQVSAWAARTHVQCDAIVRGYHFLRCRGVPAAAVGEAGPPVSELWFSFGPGNTLVALNLYRRGMTAAEVHQAWRSATERLRMSLGPPTQATGDATLTSVVTSPVAVARVHYAYTDYIAEVTASHMPYGGLAVREQYMSAVSAPVHGLPSG